ncbi:MAG: O-antigen ligase family protein [Clostridia bacterium]|nr:O-antigen ligase family protein [Clostridia bacterium]
MENTLFKIGKRQVTDKMAVTMLVVSLFLPFFVSIAALVVIFFALMFNKRARTLALEGKATTLLYIFTALSLLASVFGGNWLGVLCTVGIFAVLAVGQFMLKVVDKGVIGSAIKGISRVLPFVTLFTVGEFCVRFYFVVLAHQKIRFMTRCVSFFFNPNYLGAVMATTTLLYIYLFLKHKEKRGKYLALGLMSLVCLVLSQSLLSCLGLLVGAAILLAVSRAWGWLGLYAALLGAVVTAVVLFPEYIPRLDEITETFTLRLRIWRVALEGFKESALFGQGPLTYFHVCGDYVGKIEGVKVWNTQHAHNIIFDSLLSYGIVGAMFLWSYLGCFVAKIFGRLKGSDSYIKGLIISVLCAVLLHGMLDVTVLWVQTGILFLFVLMLANEKDALI